jgi:hypothetical protein
MIAEQGKSKPTPGHISPRYTEVAVKRFLVISPISAPHPVWFLFTMFIHLEPMDVFGPVPVRLQNQSITPLRLHIHIIKWGRLPFRYNTF